MYKLLALFILGTATVFGQSTTVVFQPDGSVGMDAVITSSAATTNYSTSPTFEVSKSFGTNANASLLKMDVSSIPSNAIVLSANLILYGIIHTGITNGAYLQRVTSPWSENSVTWNTTPSVTAVGMATLSGSTGSADNYTVDVTASVQDMINTPSANYGWKLVKQNTVLGKLTFGSSDNATSSLRPRLEVTYVKPMEIYPSMVPSSSVSVADGALNITVINGVAPYTYSWSDGSTTKDISGKLPGLYTLTVTDNLGYQCKKQLLIGVANTAFTFTITPDGLSGKDAMIRLRDDGAFSNENNKDFVQFIADKTNSSGWINSRSLLGFDLLSIPSGARINSASLKLYGNGHDISGRSNETYLYLNTQHWEESTVTWTNQPAHTTAGGLYLTSTATTNENSSLNVTNTVQNWVNNPAANNGWKLMLVDEATNTATARVYGSTDNATTGLLPSLVISVTIPYIAESLRNWVMEESYDQNGVVFSTEKTYLDQLGRTTQQLSKDAYGSVMATQTIYDAYGRVAVSTLPAYSGTNLTYNSGFVMNTGGTEYNYLNMFLDYFHPNPDPVQQGVNNTLGVYYSDQNTIDTRQATTTTPFNYTQYMKNPLNEIKSTTPPDNAFSPTSGRNVRNYDMMAGDELKYIFGSTNSYLVQTSTVTPMTNTSLTLTAGNFIRAVKNVTTSPDNKEVISYSVGDKVIATCMSGLSSPDNCSMTSVKNYMDWYGTQSIDIHIPDANKGSISFPLPTYKFGPFTFTVAASDIDYVITDQETESGISAGTDYSINSTTRALTFSSGYLAAHTGKPLFLRVRVVYNPAFTSGMMGAGPSVPAGIVQYDLDYGRWSVNYYDLAGQLRKSVSAKGINCTVPGNIRMSTTYDYSHLGELIATSSPDEGLKEFAYNTDGQLRFSQNAVQKQNKFFSYTNYDKHGRTTESGEFKNKSSYGVNGSYFQNYYNNYTAPYSGNVSTALIIDNVDGLYDAASKDAKHIQYYILQSTDDIPSTYTYKNYYTDQYRNGLVAKTWNNMSTSWYKYDRANLLTSKVQQIKDADFISQAGSGDAQIKTTDISYDYFFGIMSGTIYQQNVPDEYVAQNFNYDANLRLVNVEFIAGGNSPVTVETVEYNKLDQISRRTIGPDLQGIDYVYTLSGKLKAINHPGLDPIKDPGGDARDYAGVASGVYKDLFGEIIEYYPGDYIRNGSSIETNTNGLYNGLVYGTRYKTRNDVNGTNTGADYIDYLGTNQASLVSASVNYEQQELANRYTYDVYGQLGSSTFGTYNNTTNTFSARTDYMEAGPHAAKIGYDENGNITRLVRNSYDVGGTEKALDDLTYSYTTTNRHIRVKDDAVNSFASNFNFKNSTGTPATIGYNAVGQMTVNADESIDQITYYDNGQVNSIYFSNNNTTGYYYADNGEKLLTVYYNDASGETKYVWMIQGMMYEYIDAVGSFDLKQISVGSERRIGVYKQDVTGLDISTGHLEYELTDHLGNVRVTFKQGSGTSLEVLSKVDYYAFGGTLPGRMWQQSGGDYRFGYQGQEKSTQPDVNWDEFELRLYNHDLGRWSAPDPYGQFHSPYIAMGNNPVSMIDPDGGYINMSEEGQAARAKFQAQLDYDRFLHRGRFSYEWLYPQYKDALEALRHQYLTMNDLENGGGAESTGFQFLEALLRLNNDFMGLGLGSEYLSSGTDYVTRSTVQTDYGSSLYKQLQDMNGTSAMMEDKANSLHSKYFDPFEAGTQKWLDENTSRQKEYVDKWREEKWANMDAEEEAKNKWDFDEDKRKYGMPLAVSTPTDPCRYLLQRKNVKNGGGGWKSNKQRESKFHLSNGFRFGNFVWWDIRINAKGGNSWDNNFPGRHGKSKGGENRYQWFYKVRRRESPRAWYDGIPVTEYAHQFYGGYTWFVECPTDYLKYGGKTHKSD